MFEYAIADQDSGVGWTFHQGTIHLFLHEVSTLPGATPGFHGHDTRELATRSPIRRAFDLLCESGLPGLWRSTLAVDRQRFGLADILDLAAAARAGRYLMV